MPMPVPLRQVAACAAISALGLLTAACNGVNRQRSGASEGKATPFVFQALNLSQSDASGRILWRVRAPEARYDLSTRVALASGIAGEIHQQGQLLYRLSAPLGTVINDGQVIQLEGAIVIQRLGAEPVTIQATRMRWYPREQRIALDRHAEAFNAELRLQARQATLLLERDLLQLRGEPRVESRSPLAGGAGPLQLRVQQLDWSPGLGAITASGKALARQQTGSGPARTLEAAGLRGNTRLRRLELLAPVRLDLPDRRAWLLAGTSVIDLASSRINSPQPFRAAVAALQIQGADLQLDLNRQLATIGQRCRLSQPDAVLSAGRCSWNWDTDRVHASGSVVLRRGGDQQITRAGRLSGRLGAEGALQFSAPGSRVRSTLTLPAAPPRPADRPVL